MRRAAAFLLPFLLMGPAMAETTLTVGTTGDYPPLTAYDAATGRYSGDDIDLVEAFAADRGMTVTFIATTWPTMMDDLLAGKFRMAVGGISATPERARQALLSDPIAITGKVALVRSGEEAEYASLAAIDRPGVRVVENPGGTNESFAEGRMKHATVTLVADNADAFTALETGAADVMFTDSVEAVWHQSQHEGLVAVHPDRPYTRVEKVFVFAKDETALRDAFNRWLRRR
jgi:cyclohexadienyl dehydratase